MAKIIDEETGKALEELVGKRKEKKEEEKEEKEEKAGEKNEEEQAAVWLTGGLEGEVGNVVAPVLQSNPVPVESLEDFASAIPGKKEEEKKEEKPYDVRMYETRGEYDSRKEVYEETAENLFGRLVKPLDTHELRQDFPRVRMPTPTEFLNKGSEREEIIKYIDKKPAALESQGLSFLQHEKRLDVRKYKKG